MLGSTTLRLALFSGTALAEIGEMPRARQLCEKLLNYASPLGLYAEEIDPRSGRHLGNFPQAFTHLAQINAVMHVIRADSNTHTRRPSEGFRPADRLEALLPSTPARSAIRATPSAT